MEDGGDEGFGGSRGHRSLSRREAGDGDEGTAEGLFGDTGGIGAGGRLLKSSETKCKEWLYLTAQSALAQP